MSDTPKRFENLRQTAHAALIVGIALGIAMLRAIRLAIEDANAQGGYHKRKIPFELCVRNDNALWGASGSEVIHLAYKDNVWAIIGGIDGANTHIAIRVALKIEIPWMTPGDLDPTYIETNIPWVMRCIGDDRQMSYLLVDYMLTVAISISSGGDAGFSFLPLSWAALKLPFEVAVLALLLGRALLGLVPAPAADPSRRTTGPLVT